MPQLHLRAEPGDYAPIVLLPGDPNRATAIAALFDGGLQAARRVNEHRLMYGYTGTYRGVPISVQTTGMGAPSAAIVVEELLRLGARRLVRVGTCGGIGTGIRTGEIVIASAASPFDGTTATYLHGEPYAPAADFELTRALVDAAAAAGAAFHVGPICTVDVFYNPDGRLLQPLGRPRRAGLRDGELGRLPPGGPGTGGGRRRAGGDDLTVSDVLGEGVTSEDSYLPLDELERRTATTLQVALAAATRRPSRRGSERPAGDAGGVPGLRHLRGIGVSFAWWREQSLRLEAAGYAGVAVWDHFISRGVRSDRSSRRGRPWRPSAGRPRASA